MYPLTVSIYYASMRICFIVPAYQAQQLLVKHMLACLYHAIITTQNNEIAKVTGHRSKPLPITICEHSSNVEDLGFVVLEVDANKEIHSAPPKMNLMST